MRPVTASLTLFDVSDGQLTKDMLESYLQCLLEQHTWLPPNCWLPPN